MKGKSSPNVINNFKILVIRSLNVDMCVCVCIYMYIL
jgi:hypothetical protein